MMTQTRRKFLTALSLAGAAGLLRAPLSQAAGSALETTAVRLQKPGLCVSSLYIAEELLRAEGFTDIRYDDASDIGAIAPVARGEVDFAPIYASQSVRAIDAGERVTLLAGVMVGCFELFAKEGIGSIAELKGKSIGVQTAGSLSQQLVTLMAAQVGLDPANDIHWVTDPRSSRSNYSSREKLTRFWVFRLRPRICGPAVSATLSSTPAWTARGRNISVA
jgi:NitT/TauT family transport system substrate-binding protein